MDPGLARYIANARAAGYASETALFNTPTTQESLADAEQVAQIYTDTPSYEPLEDINNIILASAKSTPRVKFDWGEYTAIDLDATKQKTPPPMVSNQTLPWFMILLRLSWLIILLIFNTITFFARHTFITMILFLYITWLMIKYPAFGKFLYSKVLRLEITSDRPRNWLGRLHDYWCPEVDDLGRDTSRYPSFGGIFNFLGYIRTRIPSNIYRWSLISVVVVMTLSFLLLRTEPKPVVEHEDDWWNHKRFTSHEPIRYKDWDAWVAAGPAYHAPASQDNRPKATVTVTEHITDYITVEMCASDPPAPSTVTCTHSVTKTEYAHGDHVHSHGGDATHVKYGELPTAHPVKRTKAVSNGKVFCAVCRQMHCCEVPY